MGLFDRLRGSGAPRVAFVGVDGVPYSLISENPDTFPNLNAIAEEGAGGPIESIVPPESSACWPSLTTGKNPGETGVYGFQDREIGTYDTYVPMGRDVQVDRIWDRVQSAGREASVFNVPVTFPPQRDVQRMVSGFLAPGIEKGSHPEDVAEFLKDHDYKIDVNAKLGHKEDKTEFIQDAHDTLDARHEVFQHYIEQDDWDLFFGVFMTTDRVNHFLFKDYQRDGEYKEEFLEFYEKVDEYIGNIRDALPEDVTLVVASDHGFTTLDHEVHLNEWLEQEGWLSYEEEDHDSLDDIDEDTKAYSFIPGRFYINLEGREPRGSVSEDDYREVRDELAEQLRELEGPDGRKVVDRVVMKEEAFDGEHDDIAPDLVAIPNHGYDLKAGFRGDTEIFTEGPRDGMHSFENAALLVDDDEVNVAKETNLFDITPTLLDLLELDYDASEFDGRSLA